VLDVNPAHAVRGPKYSQKNGKTPVLDRDEARALLAAIDTSSLTGLRDRALIGTMIYTFARVGAVLQMNVADYFTQGRRGRVTLQAKINVALDPRLHGARIYEVLLQRSILGLTHIGNDKR